MLRTEIKIFYFFGLVLIISALALYVMHGHLFLDQQKIPTKYAQIAFLSLVLLDIILSIVFYFRYKSSFFLFGIVIIIATLTPHLLDGHILLPKKFVRQYDEIITLTFNLGLAGLFYWVYRGEAKRINEAKRRIGETLNESCKYIGKINVQMKMLNEFTNLIAEQGGQEKNIFTNLLAAMVSSAAKAERGLIRFIDKNSQRTIKEFYYHQAGNNFAVKLSNKAILDGNGVMFENGNGKIMLSDFSASQTRAVFYYEKNLVANGEADIKLLEILLHQAHLLFLANSRVQGSANVNAATVSDLSPID